MREFDLLKDIYHASGSLPAPVTLGPGDDMGIVQVGQEQVLATVDQLADGIHFDLATTALAKVGRKAMTRNLSDVAAMAATPIGAVAAAAVPRSMTKADAHAIFAAMRETGLAYGCPLFGGDITIWDQPLLITVTILAQPAGIDPVLRQGAQVGDVVCVTGSLGGSLANVAGYIHHLDFEPRLAIARALAGDPGTRPHCMIDLSDGLARDLGHLCEAANVRARIDATSLPISDGAQQSANESGQPTWRHAVADGEDYELCFTVSPEQAAKLPGAIDGIPITRIGRIEPASDAPLVIMSLPDGTELDLAGLGWEHHT